MWYICVPVSPILVIFPFWGSTILTSTKSKGLPLMEKNVGSSYLNKLKVPLINFLNVDF